MDGCAIRFVGVLPLGGCLYDPVYLYEHEARGAMAPCALHRGIDQCFINCIDIVGRKEDVIRKKIRC